MLNHLYEGMEIPYKILDPVTQDQLNHFSQASGDFNPIHLNLKAAQEAGLPGIIAHGMLVASWVCNRAMDWMVDYQNSHRIYSFQTRFKHMVMLGDTLSIGGIVKTINDQMVCIELFAKNQKNEITIVSMISIQKI